MTTQTITLTQALERQAALEAIRRRFRELGGTAESVPATPAHPGDRSTWRDEDGDL
jgi:hypothetical protein